MGNAVLITGELSSNSVYRLDINSGWIHLPCWKTATCHLVANIFFINKPLAQFFHLLCSNGQVDLWILHTGGESGWITIVWVTIIGKHFQHPIPFSNGFFCPPDLAFPSSTPWKPIALIASVIDWTYFWNALILILLTHFMGERKARRLATKNNIPKVYFSEWTFFSLLLPQNQKRHLSWIFFS